MDGLVFSDFIIPSEELRESFDTSGGPGGQHANRSETAVRLRFDIAASSLPEEVKKRLQSRLGGIVEVVSSDQRSQLRNRRLARRRLVERLESGLDDPKSRRKTKPTRASVKRRQNQKKSRSELKKSRQKPSIDD